MSGGVGGLTQQCMSAGACVQRTWACVCQSACMRARTLCPGPCTVWGAFTDQLNGVRLESEFQHGVSWVRSLRQLVSQLVHRESLPALSD